MRCRSRFEKECSVPRWPEQCPGSMALWTEECVSKLAEGRSLTLRFVQMLRYPATS
jgi:hypothetical protein